ncbi:hypothetical protein H4Q26_008756 [Puccinia striiformis f. sp. tritici PST-130]|nr:hypothetical protein H4Q26_008756 [Puccinia striiformis f. sp. tritici PST-130]
MIKREEKPLRSVWKVIQDFFDPQPGSMETYLKRRLCLPTEAIPSFENNQTPLNPTITLPDQCCSRRYFGEHVLPLLSIQLPLSLRTPTGTSSSEGKKGHYPQSYHPEWRRRQWDRSMWTQLRDQNPEKQPGWSSCRDYAGTSLYCPTEQCHIGLPTDTPITAPLNRFAFQNCERYSTADQLIVATAPVIGYMAHNANGVSVVKGPPIMSTFVDGEKVTLLMASDLFYPTFV